MLTIRKEQMDAFGAAMLRRFEGIVLRDLKKHFPLKCEDEGDEATRRAIHEGIARAAKYGVTIEYDVERFIFLMYFLSPDFDRDPDMPQVGEILNDPHLHGRAKMDGVCALAHAELGVPAGDWS